MQRFVGASSRPKALSIKAVVEEPRLPETSLLGLIRTQDVAHFTDDSILFDEADPANYIYLVEGGLVCLYERTMDGSRWIEEFCFPGDFIGLSFGRESPYTAQCLAPTTVRRLLRSRLTSACVNSTLLSHDFSRLLCLELARAREYLPMLHLRADQRVARLVRCLADRCYQESSTKRQVALHMNRQDIADFLGLTIETVCRTFAKLRADGLLAAPTLETIEILDEAGLSALADGNCCSIRSR